MTDSPRAYSEGYSRALSLAAELHAHQWRKADPGAMPTIPYVAHLLEVSALVWLGGGSETAAIAGLFHDALEDQAERLADLGFKDEIPEAVWEIVRACSDGDSSVARDASTWEARKAAYIAHLYETELDEALIVTAADKISNARAILDDLMLASHDPAPGAPERFWGRFNATPAQTAWYYRQVLDALVTRIPDHPLTLRLGVLVVGLEEAVSVGTASP